MTTDRETIPISEKICCSTKCEVYVMSCKKSTLKYVGHATSKMTRRMETHKKDSKAALRSGVISTASVVAKHFSSPLHQQDWPDPRNPKGAILIVKTAASTDELKTEDFGE